MQPLHILVGNEPRAYREVIVAALRELRPTALITMVDPDLLDAEVTGMRPALVICSRLSAEIRRGAASWLLLYPDGNARSLAGAGDLAHEISTEDFATLLGVVDRAMVPVAAS